MIHFANLASNIVSIEFLVFEKSHSLKNVSMFHSFKRDDNQEKLAIWLIGDKQFKSNKHSSM